MSSLFALLLMIAAYALGVLVLVRRKRAAPSVPDTSAEPPPKRRGFSLLAMLPGAEPPPPSGRQLRRAELERTLTRDLTAGAPTAAMDSADFADTIKGAALATVGGMTDAALEWYAAHSFPGFQALGVLAQHWLILKAVNVPVRDAVRHGWTLGGDEITPEVDKAIRLGDDRYSLARNLQEAGAKARVFGIRLCWLKVRPPQGVTERDFYRAPFNPDGVTRGAYLGIVQVDPYWCSPILDAKAAADPGSMHFYEPTWWQINGFQVHRSHIVLLRGDDVADVLKPAYQYAGISVVQKIWDRVRAAERCADEAPQLLTTKRLNVQKVDIEQAVANLDGLQQRAWMQAQMRDNYGTHFIDSGDTFEQHDTTLTDVDAVIFGQYQLVSAAANMPVTKLLGTTPKGFNATGDFDEASYHEELESIQTEHLTPLLTAHYLRRRLSEGLDALADCRVIWPALDAPTAVELADTVLKRAQAAQALAEIGAIDGMDERERLAKDPTSGYDGLDVARQPAPTPEPDHAFGAA